MTRLGSLLAVMGVLGLAGCSAIIVNGQTEEQWDILEFKAIADGRDTLVVVRGNPFGGDQQAFADAVASAMQGRVMRVDTRFVTRRTDRTDEDSKVVMLFNGKPGTLGGELCANPGKYDSVRTGGPVEIIAAWCLGKGERSEVVARGPAASGASDPVFRTVVGEATTELFPNRDEEQDSGGDDGSDRSS